MKKILHIISSPKGEHSNSIQLGNAVIERLLQKYPGSTVGVNDLPKHPYPHLEEATLNAFYNPAGNDQALANSDKAIAEIMDADILVIGVPIWNFGIPSVLKAWVDHIARAGVTFRYSAEGAEGLIKNKTAYLAVASGAIFSEGPYQAYEHASTYLTTLLKFLGITDIQVFRVEGSAYPGQAEAALQRGIASIAV